MSDGNTAYQLIEKDREYLKTGEAPGTYRDHKLEKRIEKRVHNLPDRLQHLFDDIELLRKAGYLDVETWATGWLELLDMNVDPPVSDGQFRDAWMHSSPEEDMPGFRQTQAVIFGHELGEMIEFLMLYPREVGQEDVLLDIVWGFLQGLFWNTDVSLHDSLESLEAQSQRRNTTIEQKLAGGNALAQRMDSIGNRIDDRIESILAYEVEDVEPTAGLIHEIRNELEINSIEILQQVEGDTENECSVEDILTPTVVTETIDNHRLLEKRRLRGAIVADAERLNEKGTSPSAHKVLKTIVNSESTTMSSREVAQELTDIRDWTGRVTMFARDLAGVRDGNGGSERRDVWDVRPILQGDKDGWRPTTYGMALGHYLPRANSFLRELNPLRSLPEDVLEDALDELEASSPNYLATWPSRDVGVVTGFHFGGTEENHVQNDENNRYTQDE